MSTSHPQFTPEEHAVAVIASNILLQPVNQIARMTYKAACHQAITLLKSAKSALAEQVDAPEPIARTEQAKRPARLPDLCPPAVQSND